MTQPASIQINEFQISKDEPRYPVEATKISFFNLGNIPVYIGLIPVMPGDVYQVNYEHPHRLVRDFSIRFVITATPSTATERESLGLIDGPLVVIQTMNPF
jgi:hypothetical protein